MRHGGGLTGYDPNPLLPPHTQTQIQAGKKDTKSMENLLQNERPVPRYSLDYEDELDEENINN